ncbi:MAG: hypothetical protein M0P57_04315 [Syntrophales bacterium]|jgi:hypothetical protein|nr:hypothetical protein [Syntrophales bacterium]MDY0045274.1 hypothetical protein [Syntrophales bacterium]
MIFEGIHHCPELIDCSDVVAKGGRVKAGIIHEKEMIMEYYNYGKETPDLSSEEKEKIIGDIEIRVSIRSSKLPSIEVFTIRNIIPDDYRLVLAVIPRKDEAQFDEKRK